MGAIIFILQLGLVICFGFTESSADHTSAEPNLDLECLNDYLTEMTCRLTSDQRFGCSEYNLNVSRENGQKEFFTCSFTLLKSSSCECALHIKSGFVVNENFEVCVFRRKNFWSKCINVSTTKSIKPKKPVNVTVSQTQAGDFHIVWDTVYTFEEPTLSADLIPELIYYPEGSEASKEPVKLTGGLKEYWLVGKNLKSNSNYIVQVRVKSNLNSIFSDYSDPYRFYTSSSPKDVLKIIIPITCIILILFILTLYYFYSKILTDWWVKIPAPKIATSFVKQVPNLLSFQNEFSPIHLDSSKLVHSGEKTWPVSSVADIRGKGGKDGSSSEVIYGQTGNESIDTENKTRCDLVKGSRSTKLHQMAIPSKYYKNLDSNSGSCSIERECGNSSGFSNKFYMISGSDKDVFPAQAANLEPMIRTDFEYSGCTGSPKNPSPTHSFTPSSSEIAVVPGYQSVSEVTDCPSTHQAFISSHNDFNLIMEKLICSKNPQKNGNIPVEDGYKDFQSLLRNSGEQQSLIADPEFKLLCGSALHTSPGIEIDCSYHGV